MRTPKPSHPIPTWLGSAILIAVTVFALSGIYVAAHTSTNPGTALTLAIGATTTPLLATPQAATSTSSAPASGTTAKAAAAKSAVSKLPGSSSIASSTLAAQALAGSGADLLKSIVNIVCLSSNPSIPSISGSGVIIDSRGIILTAAHVAQLFLLQDYLGPDTVTCLVRTGSPARRAYIAEPIYVSPSWIENNPTTLGTTAPTGTGEDDFALLAITGTATSTPTPSSFPAIPLTQTDPKLNEQVAIGSYGAEYLTSSELNYSLYPILVFGSVADRYTFDTNTVDLISVQGSAASQEGSSGGGMVDGSGHLVGMITTSSISGSIAGRSLNAITPNHMRRSFYADTGQNLDTYLADNSLPDLVAAFKADSSKLAALLRY
ncbi:MAG: serine protease [Candidatus Pacebacteria bacterium]|nr:serine protease [Candidatus Paceibacterota bacterium]